MLDFVSVSTRSRKPGHIEVFPKFLLKKSEDLLIRGGDFYAVWVEDRGLWSTDENDVVQLVDREMDRFVEENKENLEGVVSISYMWDAGSGSIDAWHKYCQKQLRDTYPVRSLDEKLLFANDGTDKRDYASKRLNYPLEAGECPAYEKIISTLYSPEERHKLEWAIGSIVSGESKNLQKFLVLYGGPGTGKSTILNIVEDLFDGYYSVFDAKALGSANAQFALEPFKKNPLVAIQHDGDLSKIEDNTRLNSVVSHELMSVNEKHKSQYENRFKCFLFMGTNKPVKITDGKSGILRRLIDVTPTGNKLSPREYKKLIKQVKFELGAIAYHCKEVYLSNPGAYDDYTPTSMMGASNDFYNFMLDSYHVFRKEDGTTLRAAWEMYKTYVEEAKVPYSLSRMHFKSELSNYFRDFKEQVVMESGERVRSYYSGFRTNMFEAAEDTRPKIEPVVEKPVEEDRVEDSNIPDWLKMTATESLFDKVCADCVAQKASSKETPARPWDDVRTRLRKMDTSKLHYVKVDENHIVIDFDIKDESGNKSFQKNVEAAKEWPPTYAELSKSGEGIHLHYIYNGDVTKLSRIYDEDIEIKVFTGKSSLRRMLTKCNTQPIATISSGLPLKGDVNKVVNWDGIKNEKMLRTMIKRNLNKEYHDSTACSVQYIKGLLDDAYAKGIGYDVSDMMNDIYAFAASSTNQANNCIRLVGQMKFHSEEPSLVMDDGSDEHPLVFYDIETFPNLFLVNWKIQGEGRPVVRMINPKPHEIERLLKFRLVGFNNLSYDNHMIYARLMGYTNEQMYDLSKRLISKDRDIQRKAKFNEAYNLSYTDVYDFSTKKQSLKKWEIELGIHHQELGLDWDTPVPEELWEKVAEYCDNDVIATEAVFNHCAGDWTARQILAELAGLTVNHSTNALTTKIIFGNVKKPNLTYTDLKTGEQFGDYKSTSGVVNSFPDYEFVRFGEDGKPHNIYRGEDVGFGGYVYAQPGMYCRTVCFDVSGMHPSSIRALNYLGEYTKNYADLVEARAAIKHKDFDAARKMLDGKLAPYLTDEKQAKALSNALKLAQNSVYGLTSAKFQNPFRDPRNDNNIVALRGALFMVNLKHEIQERGFTVVHCKTDSIKVVNPTDELAEFIMDYGKKYGYNFEIEHIFERICLVNNAVYIAKLAEDDPDAPGQWTATGTQFQVPYVFKTLFSKEPIVFEDLCETKEVKGSAIYLDMNESLPEGEHDYNFIGRVSSFCPIKPGCGGADLVRTSTDKEGNVKYDSVTGAKGYRWLEAEMVRILGKEADIDRSYYDDLVHSAIYGKGKGKDRKPGIADFGDFERFVADEPYFDISSIDHPLPEDDDLPFFMNDPELEAFYRTVEEARAEASEAFIKR